MKTIMLLGYISVYQLKEALSQKEKMLARINLVFMPRFFLHLINNQKYCLCVLNSKNYESKENMKGDIDYLVNEHYDKVDFFVIIIDQIGFKNLYEKIKSDFEGNFIVQTNEDFIIHNNKDNPAFVIRKDRNVENPKVYFIEIPIKNIYRDSEMN